VEGQRSFAAANEAHLSDDKAVAKMGHPVVAVVWLVLEEGGDEGEDVPGDDLVAGVGGVGLVGLHHAGDAEDALQQEGQHGDIILLGQQGVGGVELVDVVGAVVRG